MSSNSTSCLGRGLKIVGCVLLGIGVIYFLATINLRSLGLPVGVWPRVPLYVYTSSTLTLTFDGKEIVIEGTTRCRRRIETDEDGDLRPLVFLDHVGFTYHCGPEWFGHRLEDGSALLVGAYSNSSTWRRALSSFLGELPAQPNFDGEAMSTLFSRVPPAVVWLDNAEAPTRTEYYYSTAALVDPRSRLTKIQHDTEVWPASLWTSLFTGRSPSDHSAAVPALVHPSNLHRMVGHYAVALPEDRWSEVSGLKEALAGLSEPALILPREQITEEVRTRLGYEVLGDMQHLPPRYVKDGLGALPLEIATRRGGESQRGVVPPILPVTTDSPESHTFRFDEGLPSGVFYMVLETSQRKPDPINFIIGDASVTGSYRRMWFGGLLYDPAENSLYYMGTINF